MKILLLLSALVVTHAVAKESKPPGCKDPVYACQDLTTARLCGVVSDCIHDIWSTMRAPEDNNEVCDICKEMVKEARDQLLSNETQEEIKEVFEGSCELLQIKVIVDECKKIFDDLIPQIIEMLASRMDPNMVCTVAGLCNNAILNDLSMVDKLPLMGFTAAIKDGICDGCKTLLSAAKRIVTTIPQDQMQDILLQFCKEFPSFSDECEALVTDYLPEAYDYIINMDPTATCDSIGVCNESNEITKPLLNYGDNLTCEFCESLVQHLRDIILTNTTKEEFRTALLNACSILGTFSAECKQLVNEYFDMIYDFIDKNLNPETVCDALGLCDQGKKSANPIVKITPVHNMWKGKHPNRKHFLPSMKTEETKPIPNSFPAIRLIPASITPKKNYIPKEISNQIGVETVQQLPIERIQNPLLSLTQDSDCAFSKAVMFFLEKDVPQRNTKAVTTALDNVCDTWLPGYKKECEHFVQGNYKKIVELLVLGVPFNEVSDHLGLCHEVKSTVVKVISPVPAKNDITCNLCEEAMNYLKAKLKDNKTEEEIRKALDEVCIYLPKSFYQECQQFVNEYTDTIVKLLLQEIDPDKICQAIGLCPELSMPVKNDLECDLCKKVMQYVKSFLSEPKVEDEIRKVLDDVCSLLPKSWSSQCEAFVNQYTDLIITLILDDVDPDNVCSELGLCTVVKVISPVPAKNDITCDLCEEVMNYLKAKLKDNKTEEEIRKALDEVCTYLQFRTQECQQFVNEYTDTIVKLLLQEIDPDKICQAIGLCPDNHAIVKPVKTNAAAIKPMKSNADCEICSTIIGFLENQLKDQSVQSAIRTALDEVCSVLPTMYAVKCQQFVDKYAENIITLLVQNVSPHIICSLLQECPSENIECVLCQYALHFLQNQLMNHNTETEIKTELEKLCSYLPKEISTQCEAFIEEYGDALIVLLAQQLDPSIICPLLKVCPSQNTPKELPFVHIKEVKQDGCDICKTVVNYIDKLLEDDDVDQELSSLAAKACSILSGPSEQECISIVHIYGPYILRMIGKLEDGQQLCQSIDLCQRTPGHVHLLGAEKCTFGPDYWCKSPAHAAACKAEKYCKQSVWKN